MGGNRYEAAAKLTIKNITLPITLRFTLDEFNTKAANITGEATLKRKDFKIGWDDTKSVSDEVKVKIALKAAAL